MLNLEKIHEDERGEIYLLKGFDTLPEVTIFKTKQGCARGGCRHDYHNEYCTVLEGEIIYELGNYVNTDEGGMIKVGEKVKKLEKGDSILIPLGTSHYFISTQDSVVMEWGATEAEKKNKEPFFRRIVDRINKK